MTKRALILLALLGLAGLSPVWAAGAATQCLLTIKKVELKSTAGDWKTVYEGSLSLDLAAEEPAASFENTGLAPDGEYVSVRLMLDETVQVAGSDGPAMTRDGGFVEIRGTASDLDALPGQIQSLTEKSPTYSVREEGLMRVVLDFDYADRDTTIELASTRDFDKSFTIKSGSKITLSLKADTKNSIVHLFPRYYGSFPESDAVIFNFPTNFSEFSIKTEGKTAYSGGKIGVKF